LYGFISEEGERENRRFRALFVSNLCFCLYSFCTDSFQKRGKREPLIWSFVRFEVSFEAFLEGELMVMKSSRVILDCLVIALLAATASADWVPLTGDPVSLSSLEGGSLVFGDKELSEIGLFGIGTGGAIAPDADSVSVQGGWDDATGNYGLRFLLSWNAGSGQTVSATLNFKVSILPGYDEYFIDDIWLILTGASATDTGVVNAAETVWDSFPGGDVVASLSCSKQEDDGGDYLVDHVVFDGPPLKEIWVRSKDISITGGTGAGGAAHLSEFFQFYSQVPEPATVCLLGLGGLILLRRRRKKHILEGKQE
jgi:hypothetical protein